MACVKGSKGGMLFDITEVGLIFIFQKHGNSINDENSSK